MSLLQEVTFQRLLPRYERTFGGPPPFRSAGLDEVIAHMRERLRAVDAAATAHAATAATMGGIPQPGTASAQNAGHPMH